MIDAWIVVRKERHIDDKYWVCHNEEDALMIAMEVTGYWIKEKSLEEEELDRQVCSSGLIFSVMDEEGEFSVTVNPQTIRCEGETKKEEFLITKDGIKRKD